MPRVVPSQVVNFIDHTFPWLATLGGGNTLPREHSGPVAGLLELVSQVPDELIALSGAEYSNYVSSIAAVRDKLQLWQNQQNPNILQPIGPIIGNLNPVTVIRQALAKCPDEAPAPGTSELKFVTDNDLRMNLRNDVGAINRALTNGEWKAACVLAGSTIEALLLWDLQNRRQAIFPAAVSALVANKTFDKAPSSDLEEWTLHHYVEVEAHLGIIKPETAIEARLAKKFRNLIHPGRAQRLGQKYDRGTALTSVAALEHVVRDLTP